MLEKTFETQGGGKSIEPYFIKRQSANDVSGNSNLWLEKKVVIENHCTYSITNSACEKVIPQNMEEGSTEEVHGESQSRMKSFANSSSDEKLVQKVDDSNHVFYLEHQYDEKEDCEVKR